MVLLQVHQAKALRDLHEGGHDLAVLHELRAATDLTLRATKVTAQSLGRAMSTLVVQERHLWLCLADMKEQEKVKFLNAPVSQTGLFGDAVESLPSSSRQHRSRLRRSDTSCAGGNLLLPPGPGRVPVFHHAAPPRVRLWPVGSAGTGSRSLVSAPRSVSVAPADHQTRLHHSVRPASPQVQGCPLHFSESCRCPCPVCGNHSPAGEGCDRTGPSSRYEVGVLQPLLHCAQEKRWVTTDLGSASFEPCTSQADVKMMTRKRIFGCVRPLDWFAAVDLKDMCFHDSILPRHRASLHSRSRVVHVSTRSCLLGISASWVFRSTGERANSCQCRGSLFSAWSWIRSTRQHASPRYVLSRC